MKLICEQIENIKYIAEAREDGKKNFFIEGIFMQAEVVNRNKRLYPESVLAREAERYTKELIENNRAYGELGHPNGPGINLDRVSHIITELRKDGNNFYGRAKLTETPMGNIARGIMESGGSLGVSTRALGSLKQKNGINVVQEDLHLATAADIVADPSAPDAFVQGIMEGVEFYWDNGALKAQEVSEQIVQEVEKAVRSRDLSEETKLKIFQKYLNSLV